MPRRWGVAHLADPKHVVIAEAQLVKSLADLKRRLVPGAQVRLTWHRFAHRATAPDFIGSLRTVCRARRSASLFPVKETPNFLGSHIPAPQISGSTARMRSPFCTMANRT